MSNSRVSRVILPLFLMLAVGAGSRAHAQLVTASSVHPGDYLAEFAFDGDTNTRWASKVSDGDIETLQFDFGKSVEFHKLEILWERAFAFDFDLQSSDDGKNWRTLTEVRNNKSLTTSFEKLGAAGRYFRIRCLRPDMYGLYSIWEVRFTGSKDIADAIAERRRDAERLAEQQRLEAMKSLQSRINDLGADEIVFAMRQAGPDGHWYANFSYYADDEDRLLYRDGGKLVRLNLRTGEKRLLVDDPAGGVRDPVVHYDARKIVFSYRPGGGKHYHLYEIGVDGEGLKQLTDGPVDDIEPCFLPDGDIIFVSSRCNRWVNCWLSKVAVLYRCKPDGSGIQMLSSNNEHDNTPWVLPNGQIIYTRWEYVDRSQVDYHHLWCTAPDGSRQTVFFGNLHPGITMIDAKPIPESRKVVVLFSPGHGRREHAGVLTVLDPRGGPDNRGMATTIHSDSNFRDPWAFSESLFMVAKDDAILLVDDQQNTFPIYTATPEEKAAGLLCHEPRPVLRREREALVPPSTDWRLDRGRVALIDVYEGRNMVGVQRGEIKELLVLETLPKPVNFTGGMDPLTYGGSFTLERVLGTIPVEEDGSAFAELPALRSLFFVALDKDGRSVKRMQSFLTVMPGETTTCIGCHEQRTTTPQHAPNMDRQAFRKPASRVRPFGGYPEVLDFPRDIQPILDRLCVDCHGTEKTAKGGPYAGGVLLTGDRGVMFSLAYHTMTMEQLFSDGRNIPQSNYSPRTLGTGASRILDMLDGSHYGVKADERDRQVLRLWIDVGAPYPGTYAALGCGSLGGYIQNAQIMNNDKDWPTTKAGAEVMQRRCASCHKESCRLPSSMADELGMSFWRFDMNDPRHQYSRHRLFNLTRPERSLLAIACLAKEAGGLQRCKSADGKPMAIFKDTTDPDFQTLVAMAVAGKHRLDEVKRFDMPDFRPLPQWVREMKNYGILPEDHDPATKIDVYEVEQRYWESMWYWPPKK